MLNNLLTERNNHETLPLRHRRFLGQSPVVIPELHSSSAALTEALVGVDGLLGRVLVDGLARRLEGVGLQLRPLVALLVGRGDGVRPLVEHVGVLQGALVVRVVRLVSLEINWVELSGYDSYEEEQS